jgi:hypothetical protein
MRLKWLKPLIIISLDSAAEESAGKVHYFVIPSEARNLSSI